MKKVIPGFLLAILFWFVMFSPWTKEYFNFWYSMICATTTLITYSFIVGRKQLKEIYSFKWKWVAVGLTYATILYVVFLAGNYFSNLLFDFAGRQIENIYATKSQSGQIFIGLALLFLIGPAEEIFWRGFAQHNLQLKYGNIAGFLITTAVYAFVHIWSFNFMLIMAALICGLFWGWMYMKYKNIWPCIISHAVWDLFIFIIIPIS